MYEQKGFENRTAYIKAVAEQYEMEYEQVRQLALVLGQTEDFDGLLSMCADFKGCRVFEVVP